MSDADLITITVRREDVDDALSAMAWSHGNYCTSTRCVCGDADERIRAAVQQAERPDSHPRSTSWARAALFNDITNAPSRGFVMFSDRQAIADHLWEQGWRRPVPADQDGCEMCGPDGVCRECNKESRR